MAVVTVAATARLTPPRAAAVAAVVAGPLAEHGRAGREPVRPSRIRQPKYSHCRRFVLLWRQKLRSSLTFATCSCVTRGTTVRGPPSSCTICLAGVKVWFSEKDLGLGVPMMRAIDKGLAASRIGLVLVTPALLARLPKESVADKELSALLAGNRLVPIVHNTTYEALRNVSPLLASRSGLDTKEDSMTVIATKIAELVAL